MRWHRPFVPLIFVPLACGVLFIGIYSKLWTFHDISPYIIVGLIAGIPNAIVYGFKRSDNLPERETLRPPAVVQVQIPSITYGRIIIRHYEHEEHSGTYRDSEYLLEVMNSTPNTMALNCQASLDLDNNPEIRDYVALWNKNSSDRIPIGHMELLRLFTVSKFYKGNRPVETKLHFDKKSDIEGAISHWEVPDTESRNRELRVLLQSDNAHFPSAAEAFHKTIQCIMNDAVEG
jgi:hypothetical protein